MKVTNKPPSGEFWGVVEAPNGIVYYPISTPQVMTPVEETPGEYEMTITVKDKQTWEPPEE